MKKKVIALTISTDLTNEQIEQADVELTICPKGEVASDGKHVGLEARSVRVLDSDEIAS